MACWLICCVCVQLEELSITGEQSNDNWHVGLDCIPDEWAALTNLTKLELRGHSLLNVSSLAHSCRYMTIVFIESLLQFRMRFYCYPGVLLGTVQKLHVYVTCSVSTLTHEHCITLQCGHMSHMKGHDTPHCGTR